LKPGIYFLAVVFIVPALAMLNKNAEFVKKYTAQNRSQKTPDYRGNNDIICMLE